MSARLRAGLWRRLRRAGLTLYREPRPGADLRNPTSLERAGLQVVLRELLERLDVACVLDVGAYEGGFGLMLRELGYERDIVSFEPAREPFAVLRARSDRDERWIARQMALGDRDGTLPLHLTGDRNFSSFLQPGAAATAAFGRSARVERTEEVPVRRLDHVFAACTAHLQQPRPFLKVDTQGFDLAVLRGAAGCLDRILGLQVELSVRPLYEGQPGLRQALAELEEAGFELVHLAPVARDAELRLIELDCLLVRRNGASPGDG